MEKLSEAASRVVIARPRRGRGALSAKREEVPLGCNLGKAVTVSPIALPRCCRVLRDCHVASLLAMTRQGGAAMHQRPDAVELPCTRRSVSAATDAIGAHHFNDSLYELQLPSRDCTPRALPRASRSGRHVGLRPPRNDKSGAGTVLTIACANRRFTAGRGMPLPYNAPSTAGSYIEPYTQRSISFPLF